MIKSLFKTPLFKKLPFFNNGSSENHVESFNLLQCRDIGHAPSSAIVPCGSAQKQLGAPAILFPSKDRKSKKASKLYGQYIGSKKNHLTKDFYKKHDFDLSDKENGIWEYDLQKISEAIDFIKIKRV